MGVFDVRRKKRITSFRNIIELEQKIATVQDRDAITADGYHVAPDGQADRREFFEQFDVSVLLATKVSEDFVVGKIDLFGEAGVNLGIQILPSYRSFFVETQRS